MASTNHGTLKWSPYNHVQQQNGTPMRSSPLVAQSQYPQPNGSGGLYPAFARRVMFQAEQLDHLRPRYEALFGVAEPLTTIVFSHGGRTYHFCGFAGEIAPRQGEKASLKPPNRSLHSNSSLFLTLQPVGLCPRHNLPRYELQCFIPSAFQPAVQPLAYPWTSQHGSPTCNTSVH
jgi:hypothetical protein